ncbi:MAG: WYL domain-containing protein, partial [Planctomycetota bacterium]
EGDDHLRQYRLARITRARSSTTAPTGRPEHLSAHIVDDKLAEAFGATGDRRPEARKRVTLAVSPQAWPHLRDRTWGGNQRWDHAPADLPHDWHRLKFVTAGLQEARHRILGFGATVTAESPPELVTWLRRQARQLLAQTDPQKDPNRKQTVPE